MKRRINHGHATRSTFLMCSRVIHLMIAPDSRNGCKIGSRRLLRTSHGLIHHHPSDAFSILFLLGGVNRVGLRIDGETVDSMLDAKIFVLAVMIWIVSMASSQVAAVARDVD